MSLLIGDNLKIMREMESGSVDLVYLDPPFCTGRDFGAFNDKWGTEDIDETLYPQFMELVNRHTWEKHGCLPVFYVCSTIRNETDSKRYRLNLSAL